MEKELSWRKELELAENYARDGSYEWTEEHLNRCLSKAIEKANKVGVNITKEVEDIKRKWYSH